MRRSLKRRLIIVGIDIFIVNLSLFITIYLLDGTIFTKLFTSKFYELFFLNILITSIIYNLTGQYKGLVRYVGSISFYQIICRNFFISAFLFIFSSNYLITYKSIFLYWILSSGFVGLCRLIMKDILIKFREGNFKKKKVVIYGSGSAGIQLALSLSVNKMYDLVDQAP